MVLRYSAYMMMLYYWLVACYLLEIYIERPLRQQPPIVVLTHHTHANSVCTWQMQGPDQITRQWQTGIKETFPS